MMNQWEVGPGKQAEILQSIHDVSLHENKSNKITQTDSSVNSPTTSQTSIKNGSGNIRHSLHEGHLLQRFSEENAEHIRKTMISHAELFKEQVLALHKLYHIQRSLMYELQKVTHFQDKHSALSTAAIQLQDNPACGPTGKRVPFKPGSGRTSDDNAGNRTVSMMGHKFVSGASHSEDEFTETQKPFREDKEEHMNSAVTKTLVRRTFDLERAPEDYIDDQDSFFLNQEADKRKAETTSEQGTVLSSEPLHIHKIHLENNEQTSARTGFDQKSMYATHRQLFRTDAGTISEKNQSNKQISLKQLREAEVETQLLAVREPATTVQASQHVFLPRVQGISGKPQSSKQESTNTEQVQEKKKEKLSVDTEFDNKPSHLNAKPLHWFHQAAATGIKAYERDSTQRLCWSQASAFLRPEDRNTDDSSRESFGSGQELCSSPNEVKLSRTLPIASGIDLNKQSQSYRGMSSTQDVLIRQPTTAASHSFVTCSRTLTETACKETAVQNSQVPVHRAANQIASVVYPQGYAAGITVPTLGLQWTREGHPTLAAQGIAIPCVNKDTFAGPVPYPASAAWYPHNSYFQLYQYDQQGTQEKMQSPSQGFTQTSTQNRQGGDEGKSDFPEKPTSLANCLRSSADLTQQSPERSSSVNWQVGCDQPQLSKFSSQKPPSQKPPIPVLTNDGTAIELKSASQEDQSGKDSEGKTFTSIKEQDLPKSHVTEQKTSTNELISRCSDWNKEIGKAKEQKEEEINICPKVELQITNVTTEESQWNKIFPDKFNRREAYEFKPSSTCTTDDYLPAKREPFAIPDTSHSVCYAVKGRKSEPECLAGKISEIEDILLGNQASDEQLQTILWKQRRQSQPSEQLNIEGTLPRNTRHEMLQLSRGKDDFKFNALETRNYASVLSSNVNDKKLHKKKSCRSEYPEQMEHSKDKNLHRSSQGKFTNALTDEEERSNLDLMSGRSQPLLLKETVCTLIEEESHSDGPSSNTSTYCDLQRDVGSDKPFGHQGALTQPNLMVTVCEKEHYNPLVSGLGLGEFHAVNKVEIQPGVVPKENTQVARVRFNQGDDHSTRSLRDVPTTSEASQTGQKTQPQTACLQSNSISHQIELQENHTRMERVSPKEDSLQAMGSHKKRSTNSRGSEENSEDEAASEEACENLAARILLSLAPGASSNKSKSNTSAPSWYQSSKMTGIQPQGQIDIRHIPSGQTEKRRRVVASSATISWGKSIQRRRRPRQCPRAQLPSLGKQRYTSV